jgi:hypothetical protein
LGGKEAPAIYLEDVDVEVPIENQI